MEAQKTIIIVDDEAGIRDLVKTFLLRHHFEVKEAGTAKELFSLLEHTKPDLILLDLMLPDVFGLDICKEIRKTSAVPIIMLTAIEGETNTVLGFEAGADDYMAKPFSAHVLLSRIQAVLKRSQSPAGDVSGPKDASAPRNYEKATFGHLSYIPKEHCIKTLTGRTIFLTKSDATLLELFLENQETVLSRERIANCLKMEIDETSSRAIDVQVSRLRLKLKDKAQDNLIKSIRNKGYLLGVPVRFVDAK